MSKLFSFVLYPLVALVNNHIYFIDAIKHSTEILKECKDNIVRPDDLGITPFWLCIY